MLKYIVVIFCFLGLVFIEGYAQDDRIDESLSYDIQKVEKYQDDNKYDYNSQIAETNISLIDILDRWLEKALSGIFDNEFAKKHTKTTMIIIFVVIILLIIFFIYKKRPELFVKNKKENIAYQINEENIYKIDLEKELSDSLRAEDYKMSVRLLYLITLKYLNDNSYIKWETYKTPTEYIYEMQKADSKNEFLQLTNHFLRIRYGNFDATKDTYSTVNNLYVTIKKEGDK